MRSCAVGSSPATVIRQASQARRRGRQPDSPGSQVGHCGCQQIDRDQSWNSDQPGKDYTKTNLPSR